MAYAVIKTGGKQYKVAEGDIIEVEKLDVTPGTEITFTEVPLYNNDGELRTSGVVVTAEAVAQLKAPKVIAFKYRRRKGYHRTVGHRRRLTQVRIKSINV